MKYNFLNIKTLDTCPICNEKAFSSEELSFCNKCHWNCKYDTFTLISLDSVFVVSKSSNKILYIINGKQLIYDDKILENMSLEEMINFAFSYLDNICFV
jgi:hypothetical protein